MKTGIALALWLFGALGGSAAMAQSGSGEHLLIYAAAAVKMLKQAEQLGRFKAARAILRLEQDPDFQPLRTRDVYQEFVDRLTTE